MNRTRRIDSNALVPFPEIVAESGGSVSCDTQLNGRTLFTIATALLSSPFFGFLLGCSCEPERSNESAPFSDHRKDTDGQKQAEQISETNKVGRPCVTEAEMLG